MQRLLPYCETDISLLKILVKSKHPHIQFKQTSTGEWSPIDASVCSAWLFWAPFYYRNLSRVDIVYECLFIFRSMKGCGILAAKLVADYGVLKQKKMLIKCSEWGKSTYRGIDWPVRPVAFKRLKQSTSPWKRIKDRGLFAKEFHLLSAATKLQTKAFHSTEVLR